MQENLEKQIKKYEPDIRKTAYWYFKLWPKEQFYDISDLMQSARIAIWKISQRRPEKIKNKAYVRAAIRYSILGEVKKLTPKKPEIHLIRQHEKEIPLIDLLPVHNNHLDRLKDLDELCNYINEEFSEQDAASLLQIVEKCDDVFDLNLSEPPPAELKDKTRIVTKMDLSDEEMAIYANVLLKAIEKFPEDYVTGQKERARKYIQFLLKNLDISPEEFALSSNRSKIIKKYRLYSFYEKVYGSSMQKLFADIFPNIEPFMILQSRNRWQGKEGLINAYNAIDWLRRKTGKEPKKITQRDFKKFKLGGLLVQRFNKCHLKAIEFRYPGTYPEYTKETKKLWKTLTTN